MSSDFPAASVRRLRIARSLLGEPKVVLLDEPTAALGVVQTGQILAMIKRLRENGLGVIVISHNLADVFQVADRVAVLRLGRQPGSDLRHRQRQPGEDRCRDHRRGVRQARAPDRGDPDCTTTTAPTEPERESFSPMVMAPAGWRGASSARFAC